MAPGVSGGSARGRGRRGGLGQAAIRAANAAGDPDRPFTLALVEAILLRWRREGFQAPWNGAGGGDGFAVAVMPLARSAAPVF
jgi:hypothetical protein